MALQTCMGATVECSMGTTPADFMPLFKGILTNEMPAASIMDYMLENFMPPEMTFSECWSLLNPSTAAATAAAGGVLTPGECAPTFAVPWIPGSLNVLYSGEPALGDTSQLICTYMGIVSFIQPGQFEVQVPA